jgi:uncharacterized repeat protein (TIGR01451 family)
MMKTAATRLNIDTRDGLAGPVLAALLLLLMLLPQTGQSGTPAGTAISNQVALDFEIASIPQQTISNNDVFTVQGLIDVSISKSAAIISDGQSCNSAPCDPVPGATIRYTLLVDVSGAGTAENLLITDSIPANTLYTPSTITLDSSTLTDGPGDDPGSFSGNLVSVDLGDTSGPANFVITLDVTIN